jgi:FAD/FMN-containing dehydrogenase
MQVRLRDDYRSWGRIIAAPHLVLRPDDPEEAAQAVASGAGIPAISYGCGRSYGDVALNPGGRLIDCRNLDCFIAFDRTTGLLTCEAGVTLAEILATVCRPDADGGGWFLPVSPGTRFVTIGGAIANDVHGKNHHRAGSFGCHVVSVELARSDGTRRICSAGQDSALFAATIGGLGLTGVILRATIQMQSVAGLALESEHIRFDSFGEFFELATESDREWEYTAAWVDCLASRSHLGRGIFSRARHAPGIGIAPPVRDPTVTIPFDPPFSLLGRRSVKVFNALYWRKLGRRGHSRRIEGHGSVLYPLDALGRWNRLYGTAGFYQFQAVIPTGRARDGARALIQQIANESDGSMLTVAKVMGHLVSPGILSFPMRGVTLALDVPHRGGSTRRLLARLEAITMELGGRIYPAKDGAMSAESFHRGYPRLAEFLPHRDPGLSSAFARRVGIG